MLNGLPKPLRHCTPSDLHRQAESAAVRQSQARRIYSLGLLEEAYQLSKKVGLSAAAKLAEVNINSLSHFRQVRRKEEGHVPKEALGQNRIPAQKKKQCYVMALILFQDYQFSKSMRKCWIEAGKRLGVNGRSIEFQLGRGLWKP